MSYSICPIESLSVNINEEYFNCLKEDLLKKDEILKQLEPRAILGTITKYQFDLFKQLCKDAEEILEQDIDEFFREQADYDGSYQQYDYEEDYAIYQKLDINTGFYDRNSIDFDGYVYEFDWGSSNVYESQFKNKSYLIEEIKKYLYIPTKFNLEENIILISAVRQG